MGHHQFPTKGENIYFDLLNECVKLSEQIVLVTVASTSRKCSLRFDDKGKSKVLTGPILQLQFLSEKNIFEHHVVIIMDIFLT